MNKQRNMNWFQFSNVIWTLFCVAISYSLDQYHIFHLQKFIWWDLKDILGAHSNFLRKDWCYLTRPGKQSWSAGTGDVREFNKLSQMCSSSVLSKRVVEKIKGGLLSSEVSFLVRGRWRVTWHFCMANTCIKSQEHVGRRSPLNTFHCVSLQSFCVLRHYATFWVEILKASIMAWNL